MTSYDSFYELKLKNWCYRKHGSSLWHKSRTGVETTEIFADLLNNNQIVDPFIDDNENLVSWVTATDWDYKVEFTVDESVLSLFKSHFLVFEGLDTFTEIYLNDANILKTNNMFTRYKLDVTGHLIVGNNILIINFSSAFNRGKLLEEKHGQLACSNGDPSRVYVRKAQYHYGWDWGPVLMTCGPYKPVSFIGFNSYIEDVYIKYDILDDKLADITIEIETLNGVGHLKVFVISPNGRLIYTSSPKLDNAITEVKMSIKSPELWFPKGYGEQNLYQFKIQLLDQELIKTVGLRKVELVQEPLLDSPGTSFYFRINDIPIYINGSNWIPGHSFPTLLNDEDYETWLQLLVDGNQNLVRVWGGGYYEADVFYDICDRLGILVWQDFMFACGQYPGYPEFIADVEEEVTHQLKRLRNHCCLTIYAGNNEDYQIAEELHLDWDKDDLSGDYSKTNFPARTIYENTLPRLVKKYSSSTPYHPGSPWGGQSSNDVTIGDIHQWNVWHGTQEKYQDWYKLGGRFVSEFGMEALPDLKTYKQCITDSSELYPQSRLVDHHNKADGFERRLALYVIENIKISNFDLESWIYSTQLMQSECLGYAYKCWRRRWIGPGKRYQGGAIVWQLNDCWPVASWSLVDFYRRPKLAYYSVKRESGLKVIGMYRNIDTEDHTVDIWGVNSTTKVESAILKIDFYDIVSGKRVNSGEHEAELTANGCTTFREALSIPKPESQMVVYATLYQGSKCIASAFDWPQPLKYLKFPNRKVSVEVYNGYIKVKSDKPVKGVQIVTERDIFLEDNGFDMISNQEKIVVAPAITSDDKVKINFYQME